MRNMITKRRRTGNIGEDLACKYLKKRGFKIIDRNYLKRCGEIDIIAKNNNTIHFIEVKSVSREIPSVKSPNPSIGVSYETSDYRPEDNINKNKIRRIARTMQSYFEEKGLSVTCEWCFDVIVVYIDKKRRLGRVNMIKDIIL